MAYNPELSKATEEIVTNGLERKYYRFRKARFYGGIASADAVGCNLRCKFCWSWRHVTKPEKYGRFYSPEEVAERLIKIADENKYSKFRVTGGEPTIGREHLLKLIEILERERPESLFILETNGILLGNDENYAKELSKFSNLHVRVSLKGCNEQEFSKLTGAKPEAFKLQLKALENLMNYDVSCHPAVMVSFSKENAMKSLTERLARIIPLTKIEYEEIIRYPRVVNRLRKANLV